jgi:hypothetical protein
MVNAPVLFITFARQVYARQAFDAIKRAKPVILYFYSNKARIDKPDEIMNNNQIRAFVAEIDWNCELKTFFREEYVDIYTSLWSAIDWVFANEETAIILEEDCVASPPFFEYCEQLLVKYKNEPRVWMISGDNFTPKGNPEGLSYFFSCFSHIYGWAGWADRWEKMDRNLSTWPELRNSKHFKEYYSNLLIAEYHKFRVNQIFNKMEFFNPWDYIFIYNQMKNNAYAVVPSVNLVTDIGIYGIHHNDHVKTANYKIRSNNDNLSYEFNITLEPEHIALTNYDLYHFKYHIIAPLLKRKFLKFF